MSLLCTKPCEETFGERDFSNGKAIIGQNCKKVPWEPQDGVDNHYSIVCRKNGYINEQGEIIELGNFTFEEIVKKINWIEPILLFLQPAKGLALGWLKE